MRLFVAVELEPVLKRSLSNVVRRLDAFRGDVRFVREEQMHVTVKFLGEVAAENVAAVSEACGQSAARSQRFELELTRCGCFPKGGDVRVIWGGSDELPAGLQACVEECESRLEGLGFPPEQRPFSAHVTVGRVKYDKSGGRLRQAVEALRVDRTCQMVDSLTLFESRLTRDGAKYAVVSRHRFSE